MQICFVRAADQKQDRFRAHNGLDSHGVSLAGTSLTSAKKRLLAASMVLGQIHTVRGLGELVGSLNPDMAVVAQPKHLDIHAAHALNHRLVRAHSFSLSGSVPSGILVLFRSMLRYP